MVPICILQVEGREIRFIREEDKWYFSVQLFG